MMKKNEDAFTGLEAAIVLIAFVVVAAVFSYVMLGAGFFTAQKSQEVVHTGIAQASSSIEVTGDVYGYQNATDEQGLGAVEYTISLTSGNSPMNITAMRVTYADRLSMKTIEYTTGAVSLSENKWKISKFFNNVTDDTILEPTEKFTIYVGVPNTTPNIPFTITMQPEQGALTTIKRTAPASIYPVNILR
jgi:flagellin FlaB